MANTQRDVTPELRRLGRGALDALEVLLNEQDTANFYELIAQAARCLVRLRDHLIEQRRAGAPVSDRQSEAMNAIISVASSAEYPLVGVRWERVRRARDALREFLSEAGAGVSPPEKSEAGNGEGVS